MTTGIKPDERLALEFISVLGMPPPEFARTAATLGVGAIGLAVAPFTANPHGFPHWDLRTDKALVRETRAALAAHNVRVSLGEGFLIMLGREIADSEAGMAVLAELGAPCFNAVVVESDRQRAVDQFALFAELASGFGAAATIEFLPLQWPATLQEAAAFVSATGAPNARLLVDAMHVFRSGGQALDIGSLDPAMIGYVQICDVPMPARLASYGDEARSERLCPGAGDLPLTEFCAALPPSVTVGLEVPMVAKATAGEDAVTRLTPCVAAARALLAA